MIGFYEDYFKRKYQAFVKKQINAGCPTHFHGEAELSYVLSGTHLAVIGGKEYVLTAGDAYFLNPFDVHKYESPDNGEHILLTVRPNEYLRVLSGKNLNLPNFLGDKEYNKKIFDLLRFALEKTDSDRELNEYERQGFASLIVGAIIRRYGEKSLKTDKTELTEILNYINENYKSELSRASVAEKFGYSPNYFSKLFKKCFNMGFTEYVLNLKYQKTLIECGRSGAKRSDIIAENFSNPQTFYRLDKKYNSDYRKLKNYHG